MDDLLRQEIVKAIQEIIPLLKPELVLELSNIGVSDLSIFHFSLGLWIRNNVLTDESDIYKMFIQNGVSDKDDMSVIIVFELYQKITHK